MRMPVWNSFGGRIAPLDTFQHVVPGGITFLTKIYTSHAADVCRPLSLFLLLLHNADRESLPSVLVVLVAIICNNNRNNDKGRHTPAAWLVYIFVRNATPPGTTC